MLCEHVTDHSFVEMGERGDAGEKKERVVGGWKNKKERHHAPRCAKSTWRSELIA